MKRLQASLVGFERDQVGRLTLWWIRQLPSLAVAQGKACDPRPWLRGSLAGSSKGGRSNGPAGINTWYGSHPPTHTHPTLGSKYKIIAYPIETVSNHPQGFL